MPNSHPSVQKQLCPANLCLFSCDFIFVTVALGSSLQNGCSRSHFTKLGRLSIRTDVNNVVALQRLGTYRKSGQPSERKEIMERSVLGVGILPAT